MGQAILFKTTYNTTETNTFIQTYKELLYIYQHGTLMHNSSNCCIKIQTANVKLMWILDLIFKLLYIYSCSEFILLIDGLKKK